MTPCPIHGTADMRVYHTDAGRRYRCWPCKLESERQNYMSARERAELRAEVQRFRRWG